MATKTKAAPKGAITLLKEDHDKVRELLDELEKAAMKEDGDAESLREEIENELKILTTVDEEILYPAFLEAASKKDDTKLFYEAVEEHHVVDMVLPEIDAEGAGSPEFAAKAKVLKDLVEHHAEEEEKEMFPRARKLMDKDALATLGEQLAQRKRELKEEDGADADAEATTTRSSRGAVAALGAMSALRAAVACALIAVVAPTAAAAPVAVHLKEGNARGFILLETLAGEVLAHGELRQDTVGDLIKSRLMLQFADGSRYDETVTYSQHRVFRLESYKLIQRGPSYPETDVAFDRKSGRYTAKVAPSKGAAQESASGTLELPPDVYNGMALTIIKNLPAGSGVAGRLAVFTPKPRLIEMGIAQESSGTVKLGPSTLPVTPYLVKLEVGGLTGVVATVIGKDPPDLRYWVVGGAKVPAFGKFEGAMFLNGPVWRIRQTLIEWPR